MGGVNLPQRKKTSLTERTVRSKDRAAVLDEQIGSPSGKRAASGKQDTGRSAECWGVMGG